MATAPYNCFAVAAPGLESLTAAELTALGEQPRIEEGGVAWEGDARSLMRANLWLRTASRVLVRIARFNAMAFYELEKRARKIPWREFVASGRSPDFRVTAHKSRLYHSDGIAQRLRDAAGGTEGAGKSPQSQLFVVRVVRDEFVVSADSSGELLHMRGYRQDVGKAPLRETLAAALLLGAGWDGQTPLLDPFCGSGTIPIEGALIARRIAPGLHRSFAFTHWPTHDGAGWTALLTEARERVLASSPVPIRGSDRDRGAIRAAAANAERAGVSGDIAFEARAVSAIDPPEASSGLVATNPPYGVRVGEVRKLRDLYARFGRIMREQYAGWSVAMYASREELTAQTALSWAPLFRTTNGGLRIQALHASGRFLH